MSVLAGLLCAAYLTQDSTKVAILIFFVREI